VRTSGRLVSEDQYVGRHPAWRDAALTTAAEAIVKGRTLITCPTRYGQLSGASPGAPLVSVMRLM
jgi:hypothetical protein